MSSVNQFTNNAATTLAAALTSTATTVSVASGTGSLFPTLTTAGQVFAATLVSVASSAVEIVLVSASGTDSFTIARGQQGTTAQAFAISDKFELRITAGSATNWESKVDTSALTSAISAVPTNGRQTVQSGVTGTAGYAGFLSAGTGLAVNLAATSVPMRTAFASLATDYVTTLSADTTSVTTIPASNLAFITQDYVSATSVTWGNTLAPRQEGPAYNQAAQSCLSLNNIGTDDFGNTWTNTAVTYSNTSPAITGTYMGVFNGTTSVIRTSNVYSLGTGSWAFRFKTKPSSIASAATIASATNTASYGLNINTSGSKLVLYMSSTGSSWDIASAVVGNTTLVNGTSYDIEITYDQVAGKYYVYLNGVVESNLTIISTSKLCGLNNVTIGAQYGSSASAFFAGSIQGFEMLPYCVHPAGVSFTPSTALASVATQGYSSDFYSTSNTTMYQVSAASTVAGTNPTFTAKNRVYVGEATASASAIASVVSYAFRGAYYNRINGQLAINTRTLYSHNLGTDKYKATTNIICKTAELGYVPGNRISNVMSTNVNVSNPACSPLDKNTVGLLVVGAYVYAPNPASGPTTSTQTTGANWDTEIIIERLV